MIAAPTSVAEFLRAKRIAVAGVSRNSGAAANAVYAKLRTAGYEVVPVNPNTKAIGADRCYPVLTAIPDPVDGVVVATHPDVSIDIVRQSATAGIPRVWFHRSFGAGSVSEEAVRECEALGVECIVGGCPLMFCKPVDFGHKCMRWWLQRRGRVPR